MASWPRGWSTPHLMNLHRNGARRWNQSWLEWEIRAGISVTFSGEAIGPAKLIVVDQLAEGGVHRLGVEFFI